jgi:ssDNA-binding Zn-finger/Zn-ribbon topoisomerase 1
MRLFSPYIDPALGIDKKTRRSIQRAAWRRWNENPLNGLTFGFALATPILVMPTLHHNPNLIPSLNSFPFYLLLITAFIYGLSITFILRRFRFAPCIYAELRTRGFDVCPKCGYWLRDLDATVVQCPECGCVRTPPASTTPTATEE